MSIDSDTIDFHVVINDELQYSIWPAYRPVPAGWKTVGVTAPRAECLAYIETHWTDMRPASLRAQMDGAQAAAPSA